MEHDKYGEKLIGPFIIGKWGLTEKEVKHKIDLYMAQGYKNIRIYVNEGQEQEEKLIGFDPNDIEWITEEEVGATDTDLFGFTTYTISIRFGRINEQLLVRARIKRTFENGEVDSETVQWTFYHLKNIFNDKQKKKNRESIERERNVGVLVVNYTIITGEFENKGITILSAEAGKTTNDIIHEYFSNFWDDTVCETVGLRYHRSSWEQAIKINSAKKATIEEVKILNKFGIY
jgi:hypothetical protein